MAFANGPKIVTDGLVLALDAADRTSYPGSGTTWSDLVGNNYGTLTNGPTFNSANCGTIVFDGTNDYVFINSVTNYKSICFWVYWDDTGPLATWRYLLDSRPGMNQGWFVPSSSSQGSDWKSTFYVNGLQVTGCNETNVPKNRWNHVYLEGTNTSYTSTFNFMSRYSNDEQAGGKMGGVCIYNRVLSTEEVLQNFNATKKRFGL
jgi:hypothetical protein